MFYALLSIHVMYAAVILVELAALTAPSRLLTSRLCARISLLLSVIASKAGARNLADRHPRGAPITSLDMNERHVAFCSRMLGGIEAGRPNESDRRLKVTAELRLWQAT